MLEIFKLLVPIGLMPKECVLKLIGFIQTGTLKANALTAIHCALTILAYVTEWLDGRLNPDENPEPLEPLFKSDEDKALMLTLCEQLDVKIPAGGFIDGLIARELKQALVRLIKDLWTEHMPEIQAALFAFLDRLVGEE